MGAMLRRAVLALMVAALVLAGPAATATPAPSPATKAARITLTKYLTKMQPNILAIKAYNASVASATAAVEVLPGQIEAGTQGYPQAARIFGQSGDSVTKAAAGEAIIATRMSRIVPPAALVGSHIKLVGAIQQEAPSRAGYGNRLTDCQTAYGDGLHVGDVYAFLKAATWSYPGYAVGQAALDMKAARLTWRLNVMTYAAKLKVSVPAWVKAV